MSNKRIIIFDLDGTLLDTLQDLTDSVNYAMEKLNLHRYSLEEVSQMVGNGVVCLTRRAVSKQHRDDLACDALKYQREYYSQHSFDSTKPYVGVVEMLRELKNREITVAVHTNKDENFAEILVKKYFGDLADYVVGSTDDGITKPNASKIISLINGEGILPCNAVYCGDSDVDLMTAENAGIRCISVMWGFRSETFLKKNGAKHLAKSPADVVSLALELFENN